MNIAHAPSLSHDSIELNLGFIPEFFDVFNLGVIVLDSKKKVKHLNAEAKHILLHCGLFSANLNRLIRIFDHTTNSKLQKLLSTPQHLMNNQSILLNQINPAKKLFLHVKFFNHSSPLKPDDCNCLIFIKEIAHCNDVSTDALTSLFQLSPSEKKVTHLLINGMNIHDIAKNRDRAIATIRSQLKSVFMKTGVSSQQELIRLSYQSMMPF